MFFQLTSFRKGQPLDVVRDGICAGDALELGCGCATRRS